MTICLPCASKALTRLSSGKAVGYEPECAATSRSVPLRPSLNHFDTLVRTVFLELLARPSLGEGGVVRAGAEDAGGAVLPDTARQGRQGAVRGVLACVPGTQGRNHAGGPCEERKSVAGEEGSMWDLLRS